MTKNILKVMKIGLIVAYAFVCTVFYLKIHNFESDYREYEHKKIETIQTAIATIITEDAENQSKYQNLVDENNIDLVVVSDGEIVYRSVPFTNEADFNQSTNQRSILFQSKGVQSSHQNEYEIYLKIHQIPDDEYFKPFIFQLLIWTSVAVVLLMIGIYVVFKTLVPSLESIRNAVDRLKNYDFDRNPEIDTKQNVIVDDISAISEKISSDFDAVSKQYTQLEIDLMKTETILDNSITVARTFIHDLKSPIHYGIMKNEVFMDTYGKNPIAKEILEFNMENSQTLMTRTNEILKILSSDYGNIASDKEIFDLSNLTNDMMRYFAKVFRMKRIYVMLDYEPKIFLNSNVVMLQLLSHNLIANILNYATPETEAEISIHEEGNTVVMRYSNHTTEANLNRLRQTEKIFNAVRNEDNPYSSGNGLFLVQDISKMLGGTYELIVHEDRVETRVTLPKGDVS